MVHKLIPCANGIPSRLVIAVMVFMACLFNYMLRVNMSINIIAMVEPKTDEDNQPFVPECKITNNNTDGNFTVTIPDYGVRYPWDQQVQGLILGAYFWGYILTAIPGGYLAEKWGPVHVTGWSSILSAVLTALIPLAASGSYVLVIIVRFLIGFLSGVVYPALHCLISKWSPPAEKGRFATALFGGNLGTVLTWPVLGVITEGLGWTWSFYIPAVICLTWCVLWYILVSNSPDQHKRISADEKEYIEKCIGNSVSHEKQTPPYWSIAKSVPFWALAILHYGNVWGLYFVMTAGPKFMAEVLGFKLTNTGFLSALPYLARMIMGVVFGSIGDFIRARKLMTITAIRKWFIIFSHFLPGLLLFVQIVTGCNVYASVAILTISLGFNGASVITNIQNNQDLAPNFAGTIYGIINCLGGTTGFITPILTGYITKDHNGMAEWQKIFTIGGSVYIACGIVFCFLGSGETQPWNNVTKSKDNEKGIPNKAFESDKYVQNTKI